MKALLLARVSTEEQIDALPAQKYRIVDYADSKGFDYEVIEFHESAYKGSRNTFRDVLDRLENYDETLAIVFDKIDRYTRDSSSAETARLKNLIKQGRVEAHFASDNLIVGRNSSATELMQLGMGIIMSQYYSDAISDNVKRRFEQKRRDGEWCGKAHFGYRNTTKDGKKWIDIFSEEALIVEQMYRLYATGAYSLKTLRKKLMEDFDAKFSTSQLHFILKNPFYYGRMRVMGKLYDHKYDPIITKKMFDDVQDVINGFNKKQFKYAGIPYTYRGLISCSECGCSISPERSKEVYIYYHCTQYKGKHGAKYVNEVNLDEQFSIALKNKIISDSEYERLLVAINKASKVKIKFEEDLVSRLGAEKKKLEARLEKIYDDKLDGIISESLYLKKRSELLESIEKIDNKLSKNNIDNSRFYFTLEKLLRLTKEAPAIFKSSEMNKKRQLLTMVLQNLKLEGKELRWEYKKPFDKLYQTAFSSNWLRRLDSNQQPRS